MSYPLNYKIHWQSQESNIPERLIGDTTIHYIGKPLQSRRRKKAFYAKRMEAVKKEIH